MNNKKQVRTIAIASTLAAAMLPLSATAGGHYTPGVEGLQAASAPPPGLYYLAYLIDYDIERFNAPGGDHDLPGHNRGRVSAVANRLIWITEHKVLGADFAVEAMVPVARTSLDLDAAGISDTRTGIGDIYAGPALAWHGQRWDAVATAGMWFDNASNDEPASPGKGFKTAMFTGGLTWYFDTAKTVSASGLLRFERNGENDDGFRPGNGLTFEWGVGKRLGAVQAGVVGYSQWQVSDDRGRGASDDRASRHAVGLQVDYALPGTGVLLKAAAYKEIEATAGTDAAAQGSLLRLTIVKAF
ncbi:transporter [Pseudomonas sp. zfem002]|uniref:SphA family protein n=1 Tax=Pseudomonas sp. zfem002 TaxID=3078197 RepID=UPI00292A29F5|nr:transporter [Pseudomonas sp. zfem002]MDU9393352.1 transporter [Pseudomonas sp. zfem002]